MDEILFCKHFRHALVSENVIDYDVCPTGGHTCPRKGHMCPTSIGIRVSHIEMNVTMPILGVETSQSMNTEMVEVRT